MMRATLLVLFTLFATAFPAYSAEMKIGYVDLQKALNVSIAGKAAKTSIAGEFKEHQKTMAARQGELKAAKAEFEKQALLLSDSARAAKEREFQQKVKEFNRFAKDIRDELRDKEKEHTGRIIKDLIRTLHDIAKREGYDLILEKAESSILYAVDSIDLTEKLTKAYDAKYKAQTGK